MNVFPQDRLQSAEEWLERIDTVMRQRKKLREAQHDRKLEQSISALVAAVNSTSDDETDSKEGDWAHDFVRKHLNESKGEDRQDDPRPSMVGRLFNWMRGRESGSARTSSTNQK